jgi:subtilisin-like proprotein convertase family protein
VNVTNTGNAFTITNPNTDNLSFPPNSTQTITWNVAGTTENNINTSHVNILLSTDDGQTFQMLLANTPNDGSENIVLPNVNSAACRILIESVGNIFYTVSKRFGLGYELETVCQTYTNNTSVSIPSVAPGTYNPRTISVNQEGIVSNLSVFTNFTHTWMSDVVTDISGPENPTTFIKMFNNNCGNRNGTINLKFNDTGNNINCNSTALQTVRPSENLSYFNGKSANGNWTFRAYDNYQGDNGTLNSWGIELCTQIATLSIPTIDNLNFTVYPNPNKGNFTIQFNSNSSSPIIVEVVDLRGRKIFTNTYINQNQFNENISLNNAQSGVYIVNVTDGDSKISKKIIID